VHIVTALRRSVGTFQGMMLGTRFLSIIPACTCVDEYSSGLNVQLSYAYGGMDFFSITMHFIRDSKIFLLNWNGKKLACKLLTECGLIKMLHLVTSNGLIMKCKNFVVDGDGLIVQAAAANLLKLYR
jgi:hypothetical protein